MLDFIYLKTDPKGLLLYEEYNIYLFVYIGRVVIKGAINQ